MKHCTIVITLTDSGIVNLPYRMAIKVNGKAQKRVRAIKGISAARRALSNYLLYDIQNLPMKESQ